MNHPINQTDEYLRQLYNTADDLEALASELREFSWMESSLLRNSRDFRSDEIVALQRTITDITRRVSPYRS